MEIIETSIPEVKILKPKVFGDARGYFYESFRDDWFRANVADTTFVQENQSLSRGGVVRGLHYQAPPFAQAKLVRVTRGRVVDVAVDIRRGSPTFGRHVAVELSGENQLQFFVPRGFAHGFSVISEEAVFQYKSDNYYAPQAEGGITFDDPALAIDWRIDLAEAQTSDKDRKHPRLSAEATPFVY